MAFLQGLKALGKKKQTPVDLLLHTCGKLSSLDEGTVLSDKENAEITKCLALLRTCLVGDATHEPDPLETTSILRAIVESNHMLVLVSKMKFVTLEARKDISTIFCNLLKHKEGGRNVLAEWVQSNPELLEILARGYEVKDVVLTSGNMLRAAIWYDGLSKLLLENQLSLFFTYVEDPNFDVASDAFVTLRDLLNESKGASEFILANFDTVFGLYNKLLTSDLYLCKRQATKILGELLLERANFPIMTRYISDPENMKIIMNLLRDKRQTIAFEAFHVFKVFVANPNKPPSVKKILLLNQSKLVSFLENFHPEKGEDEQFIDEKETLIEQVKRLQPDE